MPRKRVAIRSLVSIALVVGGIAGTIGDLVGLETISPAYFAVLIALGAALFPESEQVSCRLRNQLPI
jgi:hypothetical protein